MQHGQLRHLGGGRAQVVGEGAREKTPIIGIGEFLVERDADAPAEGPFDLAPRQQRVQELAVVVHGDVLVDAHLAGIAVDLDAAEIEHEPVGQGGVDLVGRVGRLQFRRRPHPGFAHAGLHARGQPARRPVRGARHPVETERVVRVIGGEDLAVGEDHVVGRHVQPLSGDPRQLVAHLARRQIGGNRRRRRKAARIIAGGDGPGVLVGVVLQVDVDVPGLQPQFIGDDLGQRRRLPLALGNAIGGDRDAAQRLGGDRRVGNGSALEAAPDAVLVGQDGAEVSHVGLAGLDDGAVADAVKPPFGPRLVAARLELVEPAVADRHLDGPRVVARIVERPRRRPVGEGAGGDQVAADDVEGIEAELDGDALHHALDAEVHLRPAEAPHHAARQLVGHHQAVGDGEVLDVVGAGQAAVLAVQRPRHGRAQIGAVVVQLVETEGRDLAVAGDRGLEADDAVGGRRRRRKVFETVFHPFDGLPDHLGGGGHEHHIGEDRLLDPEAATRIPGRADAQAGPLDA